MLLKVCFKVADKTWHNNHCLPRDARIVQSAVCRSVRVSVRLSAVCNVEVQ